MPLLLGGLALYYTLTFSHQHVIKYRFIMFFLMGTYLGANKRHVQFITGNTAVTGLVLVAVLAANEFWYKTTGSIPLLFAVKQVIVTVLVFLIVFTAYKKLQIRQETTLYNRSSHFFLYIIHPFVISVICKLLFSTGLLHIRSYWLLAALILLCTWHLAGDLAYAPGVQYHAPAVRLDHA
jgi:hypothetical protein